MDLAKSGVADPGCFSRILIFIHLGYRQQQPQKRGVKLCCPTFFSSHKYHKIVSYFIFKQIKKRNLKQVFTMYFSTFYQQKLSLSSQKCRFRMRDPGSGKNLCRIPDLGLKKTSDPGYGSATLAQCVNI